VLTDADVLRDRLAQDGYLGAFVTERAESARSNGVAGADGQIQFGRKGRLLQELDRLVRIALTPDPTRRDFVLAAPEGALERGVRLFVSGSATVEPRSFSQARRALQRALRDLADEPAGRASSTPRSGR